MFLKFPYKILTLINYTSILSPDETGDTFEENAKIKSVYGFRKFNKLCFADDSGICIEALNNLPGVDSKYFLNSKKNKIDILKEIIDETKNKKNSNAFFQTTICLSEATNKNIFFNGIIAGKISNEIKGNDGFGYDPIFIPKGSKKTFAEMNLVEKNLYSHRALAVKKLMVYLNKLI